MEPKDRKSFVIAMQALCAAFGRRADEPLLEAYWLGLRQLPLPDVQRAIAQAIAESEHMPRPAHLRKMLGHLSPEMRAVRAWGAVLQAIESVGAYSSVDLGDPAAHAAIRQLGGWPRLCRLTDRELGFAARDFERAYQAHCASPGGAQTVGHLPGVHERTNALSGHPAAPAVRVKIDPHQQALSAHGTPELAP